MFDLSTADLQALTGFLQDLVRRPSLSTQEADVAERLAEEMHRVGFADVWVDRMGSVVGRIGAGRGRKLLFNAHMDTVAVTDAADWRHDPFAGAIEDGWLYGRGAVDMKGALAAMVYAAKLLQDGRVPLAGDLYVVGVVQEELCEGLAMRVLVEEEGLRPDWVVLGEPSNLRVRRGQPGRMALHVHVPGRSCHASAPYRGENAIYRAARLVLGLEQLAQRWLEDRAAGRGSLAVTQIESRGGSPNVVPDRCSITIDRRLGLGETEAGAVEEIWEVIRTAGLGEALLPEVEVPLYGSTSYTGYRAGRRESCPAWTLEEDHPLVQAMARAVQQVLGAAPEIGLWEFSTDGVYTMGEAGIPTVGFGPGEEGRAHTADECIRLADVAAAARVYARLAVELLG